MSCSERLYRIVALAPVQVEALVGQYGADADKVTLIPNGTDPDRFRLASERTRGLDSTLRLGFTGRLEHNQKGVLFIPGILFRLRELNVPFSLRIAGQGVHEPELRKRLKPFVDDGSVTFEGVLAPGQIPGFLAESDIFLFPSLFEGSPNSLIEAIMAGCVPAAWRIPGLIDFVVKEGETGVLAAVGDTDELARHIAALHGDRQRLADFSRNARADAATRFSLDRMVGQYRQLFDEVMAAPSIAWQPRPWNDFRIDPAFEQPLWRRVIPTVVKDILRPLKRRLTIPH